MDSSGGAFDFDMRVGESEKAEVMDERREVPTGARQDCAR